MEKEIDRIKTALANLNCQLWYNMTVEEYVQSIFDKYLISVEK